MDLKHAKPGEVVDPSPIGNGLTKARTSGIVRTPSFEAVRLVVPANSEIPPIRRRGASCFIASRGGSDSISLPVRLN